MQSVWTLHQTRACLTLPLFSGELDLQQPGAGIAPTRSDRRFESLRRLLGVELEPGPLSPADAYVREGDLVVTYAQTDERPMRVQIYWRAGQGGATGPAADLTVDHLPTIDLQVSVQTSLLGVPTPVTVASQLQVAEVLRLVDEKASRFEPLEWSARLSLEAAPGGGCLLLRPPTGDWSYAEMIHPADFERAELTVAPAAPAADRDPSEVDREVVLTRHLFPDSLEKGVILRGRLRGVFLPRRDDLRLLSACYASFLSMPPPLTA